jgi:Fe2+ or Zn2+ uptake regulation protein
MNKTTLNEVVIKCKEETKNALQTVYNALNKGQQSKIVKDEKVKALFDLYEVAYE